MIRCAIATICTYMIHHIAVIVKKIHAVVKIEHGGQAGALDLHGKRGHIGRRGDQKILFNSVLRNRISDGNVLILAENILVNDLL